MNGLLKAIAVIYGITASSHFFQGKYIKSFRLAFITAVATFFSYLLSYRSTLRNKNHNNYSNNRQKIIPLPKGNSGYHIFISYRRKASPAARSLKAWLQKLGNYEIFLDLNGLPCGDFQKHLEKTLRSTPIVIVL